MSSLAIYAGPLALKKLQKDGFRQEHFKVLVGASGGPKWFVLAGMDRYLFGEFFANRKTELHTIGSSVGAWRMCCFATNDPVGSIGRLAHYYSHEKYSAKPTVKEVTDSARVMLSKVLGETGAEEIVNNKIFRTHIVADRCKGIGSSRFKSLQVLHLGLGALCNVISRRSLSLFFERTVFTSNEQVSPWSNLDDLSSTIAPLSQTNILDVMIASGSIPFVLEGVRDIENAKNGLYWDGGITDYHFDWQFHDGDELVLYPHFSTQIIPGWFDKQVKWRRVSNKYLNNVVLLAPSKEFVSNLPGQKIPDRNDFRKLEYESRVKVWQEVIEKSEAIAEDLHLLVNNRVGMDRIQPISDRDR